MQNQIRFQRWILTLGGRHDWAESETTDNRTGTTSKSRDSAFTGRLGLGYAFDPTEGEQFEAGVKYAVPGHNAFLTLAVFELTRRNVLTSDPLNAGFRVQTGELRSRGASWKASQVSKADGIWLRPIRISTRRSPKATTTIWASAQERYRGKRHPSGPVTDSRLDGGAEPGLAAAYVTSAGPRATP